MQYGPESCDAVESGTDAFGITSRGRFFRFSNDYQGIGILEAEGRTVLRTLWAAEGVVHAPVIAESEVLLALADGSRLTLTAADDGPGVTTTKRNESGAWTVPLIATQWEVDFELTDADLRLLARSHITAAKTTASGFDLMFSPPNGDAQRLQTVAICLSGRFDAPP